MHDVVNICEGWTWSPESNRAQLSGEPTQQNLEYSSVGSVLTVEFISDGRVLFSGFNVTYTSSAFTSTAQPSEYLTPMINTTIGNTCPQVTFTCDTRKELGSRVSTIVSSIIQETNSILRYQLSATLYSLASANLLGTVSTYPATDCTEIALTQSLNRDDSGNYWIKSGNSTVIQVYCLFNPLVYPDNGLMRIALLNMSEPESTCPNGLRLIETPKRSCGQDQIDPGCSSVFFPTHDISYNYICGTVIGYQVSTPNAFFAHVFDPKLAVDDCYVDGISITHGQLPRQHIFTYAAARDEVSPAAHTCPCINTSTTTSSNLTVVPPFVWQNYFCETGSRSSAWDGVFYTSNPLWDGLGCGKESSCCDDHDTWRNDSALPFLTFCSCIRRPVTDDVELRICGNEDRGNEDTPIELVELHVTTI